MTRLGQQRNVLFVCVQNAGRSQMAAGLPHHHLAGDKVTVLSAGSQPADILNRWPSKPWQRTASTSPALHPRILTTDAVHESDVVITVGCGDTCPIFPGKRYEGWALDDPAGQGIEAVRPITDEIKRRITDLLPELVAAQG